MGTPQTYQPMDATNSITISEPRIAQVLGAGDVETTLEQILDMGIHPWSQPALQMKVMLFMRKSRWKEAEAILAQLMKMHPDHLAWKMKGDCAYLQCRYVEAEECYSRAISMNAAPEYVHDYGVSIISQGDMERGIPQFRRACSMVPDRADFWHHLAIMLCLDGQLKEGWDMMKWRMKVQGVTSTFPRPEAYWEGQDLTGKVIVVRSEQGWGDTIQFARYIPELAKRAKKVYFWCQRPMLEFVRHYFPMCEAVPADAPPPLDFDYHVNLMCFPRLFGLDDYKAPKTSHLRGTGIGINWFGSPTHKADHLRTVPIERFEQIAKAAGQNLKCLGYGRFDNKPPYVDYYIDYCKDWKETGDAVKNLDLIITVDTAIAHLGGFLGVETWLLLPYVCDFRWGLKGETTPWYESIKIYRQPKLFDWDSVFNRVAEDVRARVSAVPLAASA